MLPNPSAQNHDKYSNQWVRWSFFDCICQIILKPLFLITKHTSFPLDHPVNRNNPLLRISRWQYNMSFLRLHDSNKLWRDFGGIHLFFITFRVYVTWLNPVSERIAIKRNPCTSFPGERRWISLHSSTNLSRTAGSRASETSPPIPAQVLNKFKQPPTHTHTPRRGRRCDEIPSCRLWAYLHTCAVAPPPSPWTEVVRGKKAVWGGSGRVHDRVWRGATESKKWRWQKTRLDRTSRLELASSPNGSRSLWIEPKRRWVRGSIHIGSVYLQNRTHLCQSSGLCWSP